MAETRVKVYHWQAEWQRDEADAIAEGWRVKGREKWENGTIKVTYARGEERRFGWQQVAMVAVAAFVVAWFLLPR